MKTDICKKLGIEYPIFAFTHCRDVVVAVSKAGGIGVLGAVGYSPEQLKEELDWIDEHIQMCVEDGLDITKEDFNTYNGYWFNVVYDCYA